MIPLCQRIMPDGHRCGSPAQKGQEYCYYHNPNREPRPRKQRTRYPNFNFDIVSEIDSPEAIQQGLSVVLQGLVHNDLSLYQAQTMIYALNLAYNLNR